MPTKEMNAVKTLNLHFEATETPGLHEIQDQENSYNCVGYIGYFCGEVTFYPRYGYSYSAEALAEINRKIQDLKNS